VLAGSGIMASHRAPNECTRVQDAYSLRCSPQVHGAARDTVDHAATVASRELAAAVDNPVVTLDGRVESNGNFHGAPVAYVLDFLAIAAADAASIAERRTDRMLDVARNHGLNAFLADDPGVDSGHMIAQYTQAAIVSELKRLANPASVDSIPSSAMQEDHVSMGWSAARKLRRAIDGLTRVLAIEVYTAARGIEMRAPLAAAAATAAVIAAIRGSVAGPGNDRYLAPEIDAVVALASSGALVAAAESVTGPLARELATAQYTLHPRRSARSSLIEWSRSLSRIDWASSTGVGNRNSFPWKTDSPLQFEQMEMSPSCGVLSGSLGSM